MHTTDRERLLKVAYQAVGRSSLLSGEGTADFGSGGGDSLADVIEQAGQKRQAEEAARPKGFLAGMMARLGLPSIGAMLGGAAANMGQ